MIQIPLQLLSSCAPEIILLVTLHTSSASQAVLKPKLGPGSHPKAAGGGCGQRQAVKGEGHKDNGWA